MQDVLKARRMPYGEAGIGARLGGLPARTAVRSARVEAQAGDHHEDVAVVRVDRDPAAGTGVAPVHEAARGERRAHEAGAGERERDGARAVVARVLPGAVTAAPLVRGRGDRIAARDHL